MDCLFEQIINANEELEFTVKCSMLEIYNEKLHDLIERFFFFLKKKTLPPPPPPNSIQRESTDQRG